MSRTVKRVPREQWTPDEVEFDRLVRLMDSAHQVTRIEGRLKWLEFEKRFTKEQLDAMWERIK